MKKIVNQPYEIHLFKLILWQIVLTLFIATTMLGLLSLDDSSDARFVTGWVRLGAVGVISFIGAGEVLRQSYPYLGKYLAKKASSQSQFKDEAH